MTSADWQDTGWMSRGACRGLPLEAFFPLKADVVTEDAADACGICKVRKQCEDYAFETHQAYGTWAGMSEDERKPARRNRQRQAVRDQKRAVDERDLEEAS